MLLLQTNKNAIACVHNGSRYDAYFLLEWLVGTGHKPQMCNIGGRILEMVAGLNKVRCKDTYAFIPQKLADIPKVFEFDENPEDLKG